MVAPQKDILILKHVNVTLLGEKAFADVIQWRI